MTTKKKWLVFIGLIVLWGVLVARQFILETEPRHVPLINRSGPGLSQGKPMVDATDLKKYEVIVLEKPKNVFAPLPSLEGSRSEINRTTVRPHRILVARPRVETLPAIRPISAVSAVPVVQPPSSVELEAKQARAYLRQYEFIGYINQLGDHRAVLRKTDQIYVVGPGGLLDGQAQVIAIDGTSLRLRHQQTLLETTLMLSQNER